MGVLAERSVVRGVRIVRLERERELITRSDGAITRGRENRGPTLRPRRWDRAARERCGRCCRRTSGRHVLRRREPTMTEAVTHGSRPGADEHDDPYPIPTIARPMSLGWSTRAELPSRTLARGRCGPHGLADAPRGARPGRAARAAPAPPCVAPAGRLSGPSGPTRSSVAPTTPTTPASASGCAICPVRTECLETALADLVEIVGIWGGTTRGERRKMLHPHTDRGRAALLNKFGRPGARAPMGGGRDGRRRGCARPASLRGLLNRVPLPALLSDMATVSGLSCGDALSRGYAKRTPPPGPKTDLRGWCPQGRGGSSPPSDTYPGSRRFGA